MLFRAEALCPQCDQKHVVKIESPTMPEPGVIFRYRCPVTGRLVKQPLRLVDETTFPPDAIPGWRI
jgi:hypothetical protein